MACLARLSLLSRTHSTRPDMAAETKLKTRQIGQNAPEELEVPAAPRPTGPHPCPQSQQLPHTARDQPSTSPRTRTNADVRHPAASGAGLQGGTLGAGGDALQEGAWVAAQTTLCVVPRVDTLPARRHAPWQVHDEKVRQGLIADAPVPPAARDPPPTPHVSPALVVSRAHIARIHRQLNSS